MKHLLYFLVGIVLLIIHCQGINGQTKGAGSMGIGFPDLLNVGVKLHVSGQSDLGLNLGWWPPSRPGILSWSNLFSVSGDLYYHFGGTSQYSEIRPWYGRIGLDCIMTDGGWWFTYFRVGRDFNIDENAGISLDGGIFYHTNYSATGIIPFFGCASVALFYRF